MTTLLKYTAFVLYFGAVAHGNTNEKKTLNIFKVHGFDFENTKVQKLCLIAEFNATIHITHKDEEYFIPLPQDANTDGSFCDINFKSELVLNFDKSTLKMSFFRNTQHLKLPEKTTYCYHCDYGKWRLTELSITTEVGSRYFVNASMVPANLHRYASDLSDGIDIKRAYKCVKEDGTNTTIPLEEIIIVDTTNGSQLHAGDQWHIETQFSLIQIQPFLVFSEHFDDPYLCRNITASLVLVIFLPIIYFTIFILFYRLKGNCYCTISRGKTKKRRLESPMDSDSCLREESTNIASGFSGVQLASDFNSSTTYC